MYHAFDAPEENRAGRAEEEALNASSPFNQAGKRPHRQGRHGSSRHKSQRQSETVSK